MLKPSSPLNLEFEPLESSGDTAVAEAPPAAGEPAHSTPTPSQLFGSEKQDAAPVVEPVEEAEPVEEPVEKPVETPPAPPSSNDLAKAIADAMKANQPAPAAAAPPELTPEQQAELLRVVRLNKDSPLVKAFIGESEDEKVAETAAGLFNSFAQDVMQMTAAHVLYGIVNPQLEELRAQIEPVRQTTQQQVANNFYSTLYGKEPGLKEHPRILETAANMLNSKAQQGQYSGAGKSHEQLAEDLISEATAIAKEFNPSFDGFSKAKAKATNGSTPPGEEPKPKATAPQPAQLSTKSGGSRAPRQTSPAEALSPRTLFGARR